MNIEKRIDSRSIITKHYMHGYGSVYELRVLRKCDGQYAKENDYGWFSVTTEPFTSVEMAIDYYKRNKV